MTMSWLADRNATMTATNAAVHGLTPGSVKPSPRIASASASWITNAQPRRRPSLVVTPGSGRRSISGAQRNLKLYEKRTSVKSPIAVSDTPTSASRNDSVAPVSASGSPLENPINRTASRRGSR
jgi:hypothetical protein